MAVVYHDDHYHDNTTGNGYRFLLGVILLAVVLFLMFYYGLPALRSGFSTTTPQVNVPRSVDINVNHK